MNGARRHTRHGRVSGRPRLARRRIALAAGLVLLVLLGAFVRAAPHAQDDGPAFDRAASTVAARPAGRASPDAASAVSWCGNDESSADRQPNVELSSTNQIRVVYAVPSDRPDRFMALASAIATDVEEIATWWQREDSARMPRFDLFAFPGCTSRFGMLDIRAVRLPGTSADYGGDNGPRALFRDVATGVPSSTKSLTFYDGPALADRCGVTAGNTGRDSGGAVAVIYLDVPAAGCGPDDLGAGGDRASTAAHELAHTFGAAPREAPHLCPDSAGHVCDHPGDILRPRHIPGAPLRAVVLDAGRDDYYAHSGSWWDIQDTSWLIHLPQRPLVVRIASRGGSGSVSIRPGNLTCPDSCEATLDDGTTASLNPNPDASSRFAGWEGGCSGVDICDLTMNQPTTITAIFARARRTLTVGVLGKGVVTSVPAGIRCGRACKATFDAGATIRLRAAAAAGHRFSGWSGSCTGVGRCSVRLTTNRQIRATFRPK